MTEIINNIPNVKLNRNAKKNNTTYIESYITYDKDSIPWASCPFCGKRQFPISKEAIIKNQVFKCKGSNCKREFMVNVEGY